MANNTKAIMDAIKAIDVAIAETEKTKKGTVNMAVIYDAMATVDKLEEAKKTLIGIDEDLFQCLIYAEGAEEFMDDMCAFFAK